jgi:hypothetical protein
MAAGGASTKSFKTLSGFSLAAMKAEITPHPKSVFQKTVAWPFKTYP